MPDFEFTSPEGKKYTVSGPDGSTSAQAFQMLQRQLGTVSPAAVPQQSEGAAQGQRILAAVDQANHENGKALIGVGETAANAVTGIGSSIVGGFRGLAALATGGSLDDARQAVENTQHDYTYQPRTGIGKLGSELLTVPVMAAKSAGTEIGGDIGQAVGGTQGRIAGESIGNVAPDIAATLAGGRAALRARGPSMVAEQPQTSPTVNYDIPTYQRQGITLPSDQLGTPSTAKVAPEMAGPTLPPSSVSATALDAYAAAPTKSPFGELVEPVIPPIEAPAPVTALDQYAQARASDPKTFGELLKRSNYEPEVGSAIASAPIDSASKSPLDSLIAGEPAPAKAITAGLRDTSDIDSILQNFGVDVPAAAPAASQPIRGPVMPTDTVERATAPMRALDSTLRVPEQVLGPSMPAAAPMGAVERAVEPAAPLDNAVRVPEAAAERPFVATPEQHVDPALREQNLQVLRDVGLGDIRESSITGNSAQAAREFQHGKFDEPAGRHWDEQFKAETEAMKNYGQKLVDDTKGKTGLDSEALESKGRDIAAPYDAARKYFEDAKANLYDLADKEAQGLPIKSTSNIDNLLTDREFNNTALADNTLDLVKAVNQQLELHKERNAGALTVKEAESFRKWLNQRWTPDNSKIIGKIKDALDEDVFSSAGQDVYAAARQMHQLEKATLDDPKGISKLMDSDPRAPINRATPYEAIPNALVKLSNEQFKHIIDTYRALPPELQPIAQQAIATLKAHYAERMVNAGTETLQGNPRGLWNTGGVNKFTSANSAKLPMIFDANEMQHINTMLQAGEILRTNPAYPGAAAQAANASKAGLMTRMMGKLGGGVGGGAGALIMGPAGAAMGGIAGEVGLSKLAGFAGERKALAEAKAAIINEHRTPPRPQSPVDEWEAGLR